MLLCKLVFFAVLVIRETDCVYDDTTPFINSALLKETDQYRVLWNYDDTEIVFKLIVKTTGWVMFGISPVVDISESAHLMVAWKSPDTGNGEFRDASISGRDEFYFTPYNVSEGLFYAQNNEFTTAIYKMPINVCSNDSSSSYLFVEVALVNNIVYSWGNDFDSDGLPIKYGANLGYKSLPLLSTINEKVATESDVESLEYRISDTLPNNLKSYRSCQFFDLPADYLNTKRHMIKYEILIPPAKRKYVHKVALLNCDKKIDYQKQQLSMKVENCNGLIQLDFCERIGIIWVTGGDLTVTLPLNYAHRFGESPEDSMKIMLEVLFVNPDNDFDVAADVTLRLHMTKNYREKEYRVLKIGMNESPSGIVLPQKYVNLKVRGLARKNVFNDFLNAGSMQIFASLSHSHSLVTLMELGIAKNNEIVNSFGDLKYFNPNAQFINFHKPFDIERDNELAYSCSYRTLRQRFFVIGGPLIENEVCNHYIFYTIDGGYYPKYYQVTNEIQWSSWNYLFTEMNKTGIVLWRWDGTNSTFFSSAVGSVEASPTFGNNPTYTSGVLQQFYDLAPRTQRVDKLFTDPLTLNLTRSSTSCIRDYRKNSADKTYQKITIIKLICFLIASKIVF